MTQLTDSRDIRSDTRSRASLLTSRSGPRTGVVRRRDLTPVALGAAGCLLSLGIWEAASRFSLVPATEVPPATVVLRALAGLITDQTFWSAIADTLTQWVLGFGLAVLIAVPVGLCLGSFELVWRATRPLVEFFRTVPGNVLIPLAILLWGLSLRSAVFMIVFGCIWSLIVQTMYGARDVDAGARDTARAFRLNRWERARWVVLPSALPHVATGLRIASATALIIAVSAEILIGVNGIGKDIALARTAGAVDRMYALILAAGLLGIAIHLIFARLEGHFLSWHESQRRASE